MNTNIVYSTKAVEIVRAGKTNIPMPEGTKKDAEKMIDKYGFDVVALFIIRFKPCWYERNISK